ncbi:hypothetical protein E3J84_04465 [Candidatus Aerophobetes bacterium]|uniref:Uncharacterized protein n=1 Tax=Aerophobetes bacterium TaxID=2030807 RepID=A0A523RWR6_UNCAE|nr:MAG: hypothetical protein E3J84_04465 [Candidatus Aerophobetes bacterium]
MSIKCIGCNREIGWDGKGLFSYTCLCGSTIFYDETTGHLALPYSLIRTLSQARSLPHLDDLVGESNHTSPFKEMLIAELREKGFIWMRECEQCQKDGALERKLKREEADAVLEAEMIIRHSK